MSIENSSKKLKKNFGFSLINELLALLVPLLTTPYLSRILQEEIIGSISFSNSIVTYFVLFANLGFSIYGQRQIARCRDNEYEKSKTFFEIFLLRAMFTIISLIIIGTCLLTVGFGDKYNLFILILSIQIITCLIDFNFFYQGEENFKAITIRSIITKIISVIGIFTFVHSKDDAWIYVLFFAGATFISSLFLIPGVIKRVKRVPLRDLRFKKHLSPSIMIFLPTLAITIYSVFDKTMIGWFSPNPDYDNGCYDRAYKINSIALILVTTISTVLGPRNAYDYSVGNDEMFEKHLYFSINYTWFIGLPLLVGFLVMGDSLSYWYLGDGFKIVPLLMSIMAVRFLASGFNNIFSHQLFIVIGKEKYCTIATFIGAFLNVGLNFLLIPSMGAIGAAITTAITELIVSSILAIIAFSFKLLSFKRFILSSWKYVIAAGIMFVPIYFLNSYFSYSIITFFSIVFIGLLTYSVVLFILRDLFFINLLKKVLCFIYLLFKKKRSDKFE